MAGAYEFNYPSGGQSSIIKVIGVGGGGSNAVNHMFRQGISGVEFYVCNTDMQALDISPVPNKLQIGGDMTEGLGAGANPEVGRGAALENKEQIRDILADNTKMVFITAGMGGGTGTGAAPVIAETARELGVLTVGIVTLPFSFEGKPKLKRAEAGIEDLEKHCDTVLVILNNRIREVFGKMSMKQAFAQADEVLARGAKSIAEIITVSGNINVDFEDVRTVMQDAGAAVMGSAVASGENRARKAAEGAITSPLLNNTDIEGAKHILLSIVVGSDEDFQMDELEEITSYVQEQAGDEAEVIFGQAIDESLGDSVSVTIIATGFDKPRGFRQTESRKVIDLESDRTVRQSGTPKSEPGGDFDGLDFFDRSEDGRKEERNESPRREEPKPQPEPKPQKIVFELDGEYELFEDELEAQKKKRQLEYKRRLEQLEGLKPVTEMTHEELKERQEVPAYMRKGVKLRPTPRSEDSETSKASVNGGDVLGDNRFLHDNVD